MKILRSPKGGIALNDHPTPQNTCCFTGHRPKSLPWGSNENDERCEILKLRLYDIIAALYESGIRHFICGMALGCDTYFAEAVIKFRSLYSDVTLEAAIPCQSQPDLWHESDRRRYYSLISSCDYETVLQKEYTDDCMQKRNQYMIDNSSLLLAVFDGTYGGTMQTVNMAKKNALEIIRIYP